MLLRNHVEPPRSDVWEMKRLVGRAETAESLDELLGLEGWAARIYFGLFSGMVKRERRRGGGGGAVLRLRVPKPEAAAGPG